MSQAREDWMYFEQVSDRMVMRDLTSPSSIDVRGMKKGRWAAFCVYDDINRIERVLLATEELMERFIDLEGRMKVPRGRYVGYEDVAKANAGIFCFFDGEHMGEYQSGYESEFDPATVEKWGRPDDEWKSDGRKFVELACHLTRFKDMDTMAAANYGVFFRAHSDLSLGFVRDAADGKVAMIEGVVNHGRG